MPPAYPSRRPKGHSRDLSDKRKDRVCALIIQLQLKDCSYQDLMANLNVSYAFVWGWVRYFYDRGLVYLAGRRPVQGPKGQASAKLFRWTPGLPFSTPDAPSPRQPRQAVLTKTPCRGTAAQYRKYAGWLLTNTGSLEDAAAHFNVQLIAIRRAAIWWEEVYGERLTD